MRILSLLASCLLVFVSADDDAGSSQPNPLSLFGNGVKAVASPVGKVADTVGSNTQDAAQKVGRGVQKEVQAIKNPLDNAIAYIGSSQCQNVQQIVGVTYEQIQQDQEPDMSNLEIVYKTQSFRTIMNITDAPASLRQARKFDNDSRLVLFLHGFTDNPEQQSFATVSQAYLDKGNHMSILALDASSMIRWFYIRSVTFVRFIGTAMGKVLADVYKQGQDPKKIHIIGHSLGAHIGSFTAKTFKKLTGQKIGRISGLDPAGPCFGHVDPELRLQKTDAEYVDVIHTDAGVYGIEDAVGRYNFSYMGYPSTPGDEGRYFLQTGEDSPYGLGPNGTKYHNNEGIVRNVYNFVG